MTIQFLVVFLVVVHDCLSFSLHNDEQYRSSAYCGVPNIRQTQLKDKGWRKDENPIKKNKNPSKENKKRKKKDFQIWIISHENNLKIW